MEKTLNRVLFALLALLILPAIASAFNCWSITRSAVPASLVTNVVPPRVFGQISSAGQTTYVIAPNGAGCSSSPTSVGFMVSTPPGIGLANVKIDNVATSGAGSVYTVNKGTLINHSIVATFSTTQYVITTTPTTNGFISSTVQVPSGGSATISIVPSTGYRLASVTINGTTYTSGTLFDSVQLNNAYTFSNVLANSSITATFAIIPQVTAAIFSGNPTMTVSNLITIDGSTSTSNVSGISYAWTVTPFGPTLGTPTGSKTTFTTATVGTYTVTLTVSAPGTTSQSAQATVTVISGTAASANYCIQCHINLTPGAVTAYTKSLHYTQTSTTNTSCSACHNPGGAYQHPFYNLQVPQNACAGCHFDANGNVPLHPVAIGTKICISCHDPHTTFASISSAQGPHFNNISSGMYPAAYVTYRSDCSNCHYPLANNVSIRFDWSVSGHGDTGGLPWIEYDFKTKDGCVQCHTTTGFIAYSSGRVTTAWGLSADKSKEVFTCIGCHTDISTGALRNIIPRRPYADNPSYMNPDVGKSNICLSCHAGRESGLSITAQLAANADFTNMAFIDSHGRASGGTLYKVVGYRFPGSPYASYSSNTHQQIGVANTGNTGTSGPCITCHKSANFGHTFLTSAVVPVCANCHTASFGDAQLAADSAAFTNALEVLRAQLAAKGFVYSPNPPHFANTNWGIGRDGANRMGAAFNYALLINEPGAFVHNSAYAKKLIFDSIDNLYNGAITGSIDAAVSNLVASGAITQEAAQSLSSYNSAGSCIDCHGGTAASSSPLATNAHPVHLTSSFGPGSYLGRDINACQGCHPYGQASHMNGVVNVLNGTGSACAGCHPGALPAWGSTTRIACTVCHAATPAVLPNGTAAPYKASFTAFGHGQFAASNQCTSCHDPNSSHISGNLGINMRLYLPDDNNLCASCHNGTTALRMSSHVLDKNATPTSGLCKECHDPHGTTNTGMIRTTINGVAISFTNSSTAFVQTAAPYQGLCQVCHTLTNHYRKGLPPDGHPTRNCLSCHSHQGPFAFAPVGYCDSCHGYPPAPLGFAGRQGNYSSARAEDYLGGAGAHLVAAHVSPTARPTEGWANCTVCHGNGSFGPATHSMKLPVIPSKITIDVYDPLKFNAALPLGPTQYSGKLVDGANSTGNCSNVACHFKPTRKWSTEN